MSTLIDNHVDSCLTSIKDDVIFVYIYICFEVMFLDRIDVKEKIL